ncbi:MAG: hypothetical protein E7262_05360 [Lachnospiraceae bacterium]|nr:hypothetical protein [Lachnospiraceae bacterium]
MSKKFRRKNRFDDHKFLINTIFAIACAAINILVFIFMIIRATIADGNVGTIFGVIGIVSLVISAFGIYYSFKGLKADENSVFTFPLIAIIANILITVILVAMYIVGIILSVKG